MGLQAQPRSALCESDGEREETGGAVVVPWALKAVNTGLKRIVTCVGACVPACSCSCVGVCVSVCWGMGTGSEPCVPLSGHESIQDTSARLYLFGGTFIF